VLYICATRKKEKETKNTKQTKPKQQGPAVNDGTVHPRCHAAIGVFKRVYKSSAFVNGDPQFVTQRCCAHSCDARTRHHQLKKSHMFFPSTPNVPHESFWIKVFAYKSKKGNFPFQPPKKEEKIASAIG